MTTTAPDVRPLAVRVLRASGWFALALALIALLIGAIEGFDDRALLWAIIGIELLVTAIAAFLGTRPTTLGLIAAFVACAWLVFIPPIPIAIALIASQTSPHLREYYGVSRRTA